MSDSAAKPKPDSPATDSIDKSWFGSLMGQATKFVLAIVGYVVAVMTLYSHWNSLVAFHDSHPELFYALFSIPLAVIGGGSVYLNMFRAFSKWFSASFTLPLRASAG